MKRWMVQALLLLALGAFAVAQDTTPPSGTTQSPNAPDAVRPAKKHKSGNKAKEAPGDVGRGGTSEIIPLESSHCGFPLPSLGFVVRMIWVSGTPIQ